MDQHKWWYEGLEYSADQLPGRPPRICGEFPPDIDAGIRAAATEILRLAAENEELRKRAVSAEMERDDDEEPEPEINPDWSPFQ